MIDLVHIRDMPSESCDEFACDAVPQLDRFVKGGTRQPLPVRGEVDMVHHLHPHSKTDSTNSCKQSHSFNQMSYLALLECKAI